MGANRRRPNPGAGTRPGPRRVGAFVERFAVYPFAGTPEAVAARWSDELLRLLEGADAVGLPTASNMAWVLYRSGREVIVQQMLMLPGVGPTLSPGGQVGDIPAHTAVSDDGQALSQWARPSKPLLRSWPHNGPMRQTRRDGILTFAGLCTPATDRLHVIRHG